MSYSYIPGGNNRFAPHYHKINCLICGTEITKKEEGTFIPDKDFPYYVCNKCYIDYYLNDEMK